MAKNRKKKKSNKIIWILLILLVVVLVLAAVFGQKFNAPKALQVELANVERKTIVEKVTASGVVQPITEIKITPDVAGEIIELNVVEGDHIKAGMILVKIRPDNFQSALDRAEANLNQQMANLSSSKAARARTKAQLTQNELAYKRAEELKKEKVIAEVDYETARANYEIALQNYNSAKESVKAAEYIVKSSQATVKEAKENVRLTVVRAPVSGTISKLDVEKGERVVGTQQMAGTEMMRIADLTNMEVRVNVNENDIIRVSVGDTTMIDVDSYSATDKQFEGIVTAIANTANDKASVDAVTEFEVEIKILNESFSDLLSEIKTPSPFRPGMTASVEIITHTKRGTFAVPLSAVTTRNKRKTTTEGGGRGVRVTQNNNQVKKREEKKIKEVVFVNEEGKAKMVEVETGISDYDNIEILSGLEENQEVISGPFFVVSKRVKNGDLIEEAKKKGEGKNNSKK